ncbi:putative membrane protein [Escherichia coli 2-156-04_S3_C1]|nr:putative membrane protein [Escherichia coli 2-156-04_S3_C1]
MTGASPCPVVKRFFYLSFYFFGVLFKNEIQILAFFSLQVK